MAKKTTVIIIIAVIIAAVLLAAIPGLAGWMFRAQYNAHGVSHFLVITIDEEQPREYVGELDGRHIYAEKLNLDETNFRNVDAENVPIKEALEKELVSIADWRKHARKIIKDGEAEILRFENYEIAVTDDECVIRPITK